MLKTTLKFFICLPIILCLYTIICIERPASTDKSPEIKLNSFGCFLDESQTGAFDARDRFNAPIKGKKAQQQFQSLFTYSLYNLLVVSEQHYSEELIVIIRKLFSSAGKFLNRNAGGICVRFAQAVLTQTRKLVARFNAIVFISLQLFLTSHIFSHLFFTPKSKVAPLILRC